MKVNNKHYWFMSLGCNCANIPLLNIERIKGPIDNVWIKDPSVIDNLIINKYFENFIKTTPKIKEKIGGFNNCSFVYSGYEIFHNNPTKERYHITLKKRIGVFNKFLKDLYNGANNYFIITLNSSFVDYKTRLIDTNKVNTLIHILEKHNLLKHCIFIEIKQLNKEVNENLAYSYINNWSYDLKNYLNKYETNYILLESSLTYKTDNDYYKLHQLFKNSLKNIFIKK